MVDREVEAAHPAPGGERGDRRDRPTARSGKGALTRRFETSRCPDGANEIGAATWAQLILKFILSHPAVTVVIPPRPASTMCARTWRPLSGPFPMRRMRERMAADIRDL